MYCLILPLIPRLFHRCDYPSFAFILIFLSICVGSSAYADEEEVFILIENRTEHVAKVAAPGAKPVRVKPGETAYRLMLDPVEPNGVDAKAWWVSSPRQLCVIFVRYGGKVVIAGNEDIKCLGN